MTGSDAVVRAPAHAGIRFVAVAVIGAAAAVVVQLAGPGGTWTGLVVMGAATAAAELISLHPANRAPLSLFYAMLLVLVRASNLGQFYLLLAGALVVAAALCMQGDLDARLRAIAARTVGGVGAFTAFSVVRYLGNGADRRYDVLAALAAAGVFAIVADDLTRWFLEKVRPRLHGREADLALVASGILMAVGYQGIGGRGDLGVWGPFVFAVPLLGAWYSFERLRSIRHTYEQTIEALSMVPELAGLARSGHAARVATLSERLGRELGMDRKTLEQLRTAALLHHLGHLCLDDPVVRGRAIEPGEVADKASEILRGSAVLAPSGSILASDSLSLASQVLRASSALDELTQGDEANLGLAAELLTSGPGYVYDARVLAALDRILGRAETLAVPAR